MSKKISFLLLIAFLFVVVCDKSDSPTDTGDDNEGKVSISGYVFQQANGLTAFISDADVKIGEIATISDSSGRYNLNVDPGFYNIIVAHDSYDSLHLDSIDLTQGRNYDLAIQGPLFSVSGIVNHPVYGPVEGAVVRVEHLTDTTDDTGYYFIDSIVAGEWILNAKIEANIGATDTITLESSDVVHDILLGQLPPPPPPPPPPAADTLWITEDATVSYNYFTPETSNENYGTGTTLSAFNDQFIEWNNVYYDSESWFFIKLQNFSFEGNDSVVLELTISGDNTMSSSLNFSAVTEDWSENLITWNNKPLGISSNELIVFDINISNLVRVNLNENTGLANSMYGLRVTPPCGNFSICGALFYSSESEVLENRPKLLIYY